MSLRELREGRGVGLRQLCGELGIGVATLSRLETGKCRPEYEIETYLKLAKYYGVTLDELVDHLPGEGRFK